MISFSGPNDINFPHGRLLYTKAKGKKEAWSSLANFQQGLDRIVEEHPRLSYAHQDLFIYFFGPEAQEVWVGREIVGHMAKPPQGFFLFDSFKGEGFEWVGNLKDFSNLTGEEVYSQGERLKSLAGKALAKTWRVKIGPMEMSKNEGSEPFKIAFQFYKMG